MIELNDFIIVKEVRAKDGTKIRVIDFDKSVRYNELIIDKLLEAGHRLIKLEEDEVE